MKKLLTILFVLVALVMEGQTLHFHQLTVKDGLPHNSIITLAQDAKGDIWVATQVGLMRYDGRQFNVIPSDGLPDKRVDRINLAQDGTMWVQCFERHQQVSRYDTLARRFVTYDVGDLSESLRQQAVLPLNRTFADPRSSRVWTIEKRQLLQTDTLKPESQFAYTGQTAIEAGLKDETFYSLLLDRQGILWAGSANNGLFFAYTRHSHYRRMVCQPNPLVRATCMDSKGTLWIAIGDQQLLALPKASRETTHVDYPMTDSVEGRRLCVIVEDAKRRLWLGTHDGLYMKEPAATTFRRMEIASDTSIAVYSLCLDKEESLWIGTNRGVYLLKPDDRQPLAELVDSTGSTIHKIAVDKNRLWIATAKGLYCRTDGKTTQWYGDAAHAIVTDARGQTWVGTDNGLIQVCEQGVKPVSTAADGHIVKDLICWRDFLWCIHEQGLCCINIYTGQSTVLHTEHNEYLDGSACIDSRTGTLYFGGTMGIDCLQADSLDEQLRSGIAQLWLEEISEELRMKSEESATPTWYYWLIGLLMVLMAGAWFAYIYNKRRKQEETPLETEQPLPEELPEELPKEPIPADAPTLSRSLIPADAPARPSGTLSSERTRSLIPADAPTRSLSPFVLKATAIAEAHIADADFTAEQMAQELAMSRTKLFHLMKNETGKAVMEFVRDIRLDYAARQLMAGTRVGEVYMACGFSDPSSFRRSFAKKFGINPSQYRKQQKT